MKCYKIVLLLGVFVILSPAVSFAKKGFSQIDTGTQFVEEELIAKLGKKSLAYNDAKWPKDIASKKVDLANISDEVLGESIGWMKTMIKKEWLPKDIKAKWLKGLRKEEHPAADYLIFRYNVDGCKIQVQENGSATCIFLEDPNSIRSDQSIEDYIVHKIYKYLNYPLEHKNSFKFYIKNFEHGNKKIYYGKFNCGFDSKDKEAWSKRIWWNRTYFWTDGKRVYFSLVNYDGKPRKATQSKPGIPRRFTKPGIDKEKTK